MEFDPESGIRRLQNMFKDNSLQSPTELAILEARLRANLRESRRYGNDPANRAEWSRIMDGLIQITHEAFGMNFNDLCYPLPVEKTPKSRDVQKGDEEDADDLLPTLNYAQRKYWAMLVGVNTYKDKCYGTLDVCVTDARSLTQELLSNGFDSERMQVLIDSDEQNPPERNNILNTLNTLSAATQPDDLILFYYSGHGDVDASESYLISNNGYSSSLKYTAVSLAEIKQIMQQAPARNKVIILDACNSGASLGKKGKRQMSSEFIQHVFEESEGIAILASCTQDQTSYEWIEQGQSAYTYFLLQALQGQADYEGKGFVTVRDINNYVTDKVKIWAAQQKYVQTPTILTEMSGEMIVCSYPKTS